MDSTLSILGSVASLASAAWACWEAKQSARSATQAQQLRDEIVNRRKMLEVSQVYTDTKRILIVVSKVGPSSNPKLLKGINGAEIAKEIEEYARSLLDQSSHFTVFFENKAQLLCEDLREDIEALAEAKTPEEKKTSGKNIYYKIQSFMPIAKALADEKREHAPKIN